MATFILIAENSFMAAGPYFGLLNLFKPAGWSSRDVVNRVERIVKPAKAGHAGTLDPLAEGVLVVGVGAATRLVSAVQECPKEYRGTFQLGCRSDTDDSTGTVVVVDDARIPSLAEIQVLIPQFTGEIWQIPPQFSAVHVAGQRAYALARAGEIVEIAPRQVQVSKLEILAYAWPTLELLIECGSGTYIRSIGRDMGEILGCGALMTALIRTRIGHFHASHAVPIAELSKDNLQQHLLPAARAVEHWPQYVCTDSELVHLGHGRMIESRIEFPEGTRCALLSPDGILMALGETRSLGRIAPTQVFAISGQQ
ncbi:MAG: truB [Planctomycetaceae bacterium]|nr:truB [Planctomycetaceae bacterium]